MRSKKTPRRLLPPDPIYGSRLLHRFINRVMRDGKKTIASNLVYKALENIKEQNKNPLEVFDAAVRNVAPKMEVRARRIGGASYQVPNEVRGDRKEALAIRWLIAAARTRSNESLRASSAAQNKKYPTFSLTLAAELIDAANSAGGAFKKKEDMQKVAAANRAFAHFRW